MLSLGIVTYVIQIYVKYIILLMDFEKFKLYSEFKNFKNNINLLFQSKPNPQRSEPRTQI